VIEPEPKDDSRGSFARTFCQRKVAERLLNSVIAPARIAFNRRPGTIRGLLFHRVRATETKVVRATRGALDGFMESRPESATHALRTGGA
jgi:dTDP-4-dehydrorhamnose 3,5-epimerase